MKTNIIFFTVAVLIFGVWLYCFHLYYECMDFGLVLLALFCSVITLMIIACIRAIGWRIQNGVDLFATLESDPEKVKERMLYIMQYGHSGGIKGALEEFNDIFRNYPQWDLKNWEVFRAWYKAQIDFMLTQPKIFIMSMKYDDSPYSIDKDPLYDPYAPDWEQFDRAHYEYDDDDDDDDDDYSDDDTPDLKKAAKDGFMMGVGFGIANSILGGNN